MSLETLKKLRDVTSMGINDCKKALDQAGGDYNKAMEILKEKGAEILAKKSADRTAEEGRVETYTHFSSRIGAIVEVNCETDFVAKDETFGKFVKDLVMHIAAVGPKYVNEEDVPAELLAGKNDQEKKELLNELVLMRQPFVKNPKQSITDMLNEVGGKFREKIVIKKFARYSIGG